MVAQSAELRRKAREYLTTRGSQAAAAVIHDRVAAAFAALGGLLDTLSPDVAARRTLPGEWSVQEIADHLLEDTSRRIGRAALPPRRAAAARSSHSGRAAIQSADAEALALAAHRACAAP